MPLTGLDEEGRALLRRIIESQAWRQLAAMNVLGHCLKFVTRLESKILVAEELSSSQRLFREVRALYDEIGWTDLESAVRDEIVQFPFPASRLEFGICRYLCDRAELVAMRSYENCVCKPYAAIARSHVEATRHLVPEGDRVFVEYCADPKHRPHAQELFDRWLAIALRSMGRPGSRGDRRAVELGLRSLHSRELAEQFLEDVRPYREQCGLDLHLPEGLAAERASR